MRAYRAQTPGAMGHPGNRFSEPKAGMIQINAAARLPPTMAHGIGPKTGFQHRSCRDRDDHSQRRPDRLRPVFLLMNADRNRMKRGQCISVSCRAPGALIARPCTARLARVCVLIPTPRLKKRLFVALRTDRSNPFHFNALTKTSPKHAWSVGSQ
jgi:hypothetical protein